MKRILFLAVAILLFSGCQLPPGEIPDNPEPYEQKTENIVVVMLDGYRWQEVFNGVNCDIAQQDGDYQYIAQQYGDPVQTNTSDYDFSNSREKLNPFFFGEITQYGQLHGNRNESDSLNSIFQVENPYHLSYPGYAETLTGYADPDISGNGYGNNPNENVLYFLQEKGFDVAAITSAELLEGVLHTENPENSWYGKDQLIDLAQEKFDINFPPTLPEIQEDPILLSVLGLPYNGVTQADLQDPIGNDLAMEVAEYGLAKKYIDEEEPDVFYLQFYATDEYAHDYDYTNYLDAAHNVNVMLQDLWNYLQSNEEYAGKTTMIVTTDHGRGNDSGSRWHSHGNRPEAIETWMAVIGPDTPNLGEASDTKGTNQNIANSISVLMGINWRTDGDANHPVAPWLTYLIGEQ